MLMKDDRNFHVWNYRFWALNLKGYDEKELDFLKTKIENNCHNFSAYHYREKVLTKLIGVLDL